MEFPIPKTLSDTPDLHYVQFIYNKLKSMSVESLEGKSKLTPKDSTKDFAKAQLNLLLDNVVHPEDFMKAYADDPKALEEITSGKRNVSQKENQLTSFTFQIRTASSAKQGRRRNWRGCFLNWKSSRSYRQRRSSRNGPPKLWISPSKWERSFAYTKNWRT